MSHGKCSQQQMVDFSVVKLGLQVAIGVYLTSILKKFSIILKGLYDKTKNVNSVKISAPHPVHIYLLFIYVVEKVYYLICQGSIVNTHS